MILVGSVMDNIPENMALGISLALGGSIDVVLLAAIFISNFPEGLSSSEGMQSSGRSKRFDTFFMDTCCVCRNSFFSDWLYSVIVYRT